ncbi:MAG: hypothetical protein AB1295_03905 [Candidatus Micrarchaeota archaeon]
MPATIGEAFNSFKEALGFLLSKPGPILSDFAKVAALGLVVQFALSGLTIVLASAMGVDLESVADPPLEFMLIAILIAIPAVITNGAINATPYYLVQEREGGKRGDVIKKMLALLLPIGAYMAAFAALMIGLMIGTVALAALGSTLNLLIGLAAGMIGIFAMVAAIFGLQFAVPEIVLRGTGAIESMKRSWKLSTSNMVAVFVFDVMLVLIVMSFYALFAGIASLGASAGDFLGMSYSMLVSLVSGMVMTTVTVMPYYFLWKKIAVPVAAKSAPQMPEAKPRQVPKRKGRRSKR